MYSRHISSLAEMTKAEQVDLADVIRRLTTRFDNLYVSRLTRHSSNLSAFSASVAVRNADLCETDSLVRLDIRWDCIKRPFIDLPAQETNGPIPLSFTSDSTRLCFEAAPSRSFSSGESSLRPPSPSNPDPTRC